MFEELLTSNQAERTSHPCILKEAPSDYDFETFENLLGKLRKACDRNDVARVSKIFYEANIGFKHRGEMEDLLWKLEKLNNSRRT